MVSQSLRAISASFVCDSMASANLLSSRCRLPKCFKTIICPSRLFSFWKLSNKNISESVSRILRERLSTLSFMPVEFVVCPLLPHAKRSVMTTLAKILNLSNLLRAIIIGKSIINAFKRTSLLRLFTNLHILLILANIIILFFNVHFTG